MRKILLLWQGGSPCHRNSGTSESIKSKTRLLLFCFACLWSVCASAQSQVTGTVSDDKNALLVGVTVKIKGTQGGTQTNANGKFNLQINGNSATLVLSYIGYIPKEVVVKAGDNVSVQLQTANQGLDEVVVVGYGTQRKGDVTGSVATIKAENFVQGAARDAAELLRGKVAGLTVSSPSG